MVACDRRRASTSPIRSPRSSVMPALSIATSVPLPMAMPTSAAASAGRVVDAVAGHRHHPALAAQPCHHVALSFRQNIGLDLGDTERLRHRLRGRDVVAGQHDDAQAVGAQLPERLLRARLDRIGDGDDAGSPAIDGT